MKTIRISERHARAIIMAAAGRAQIGLIEGHALNELRQALQRNANPLRPKKPKPKGLSLTKIRNAVNARAGYLCECGCGRWFRGVGGAAQLDHFFGRARAQSVETCWRLREDCHFNKTNNSPSAGYWLEKFIEHCRKHGYAVELEQAEARLYALNMTRGGR